MEDYITTEYEAEERFSQSPTTEELRDYWAKVEHLAQVYRQGIVTNCSACAYHVDWHKVYDVGTQCGGLCMYPTGSGRMLEPPGWCKAWRLVDAVRRWRRGLAHLEDGGYPVDIAEKELHMADAEIDYVLAWIGPEDYNSHVDILPTEILGAFDQLATAYADAVHTACAIMGARDKEA